MTKKELIKYIKNSDFWVAEGPAVLNMCYPWFIGFCNTRKYFKPGFDKVITVYLKNYVYQFLAKENSVKATKEVISLYKNGKLDNKYDLWKKHRKTALDNFGHIDHLDMKKISNKELSKEYIKFMDLFIQQWTIPLILEGAAIYTENVILRKFREENKKLDNKTISDYFSVLTQPSEISFNNKERLSFLKVCKEEEDLSCHQRNFYWIRNNYLHAKPIEEKEFKALMKEELKNKNSEEIDEEIRGIESYKERASKEKKMVYSRIKLSEQLKKDIEALGFIAAWQDERKEMNLRGNHYLAMFLEEFSLRTKIPYLDIARLFPEELVEVYSNIGKWKRIIEERKDCFVALNVYGEGVSYFSENDAKEIYDYLSDEEEKDILILEGLVVSNGGLSSIKGLVNVVLDPSADDFKQGSILVTSMTRPEFVPLMRKAKAVITNEGGMTCHAAILSRELNIPCMVGTKRATKVLKNGDSVELKLNHGRIEKL